MVSPQSSALLSIENISVNFGGVQALNAVTTHVNRGEIHGLIGPNGSGKTTLLNVICGFVAQRRGRIVLNGAAIERWPVHRRAAAGLARTFQGTAIFNEMDVLENVVVGLHHHDAQTFLQSCIPFAGDEAGERNKEIALKALSTIHLDGEQNRLSDSLPFGGQRMVDMARAKARAPDLLLLDEPAAGLNSAEIAALADLIRAVRTAGMTVILVEHHLELVMGVCDRITVLNFGRNIAVGTPAEVRRNAAVIEAYLGPSHADTSSH